MIHFTLFRIPVAIQPFFWITMAFLGGAFYTDSPAEILRLFLFILAGFISILVHELGHALTIKSYNVPTAITLQAFGGYASYPAGRLNRKQSFLVTAAGPAIQLVLALIAYVLYIRLLSVPNPNLHYFLSRLSLVSVIWAVFNLLPILPLDGGQLLNSILGPARIKITLWVTIVTAVAIAILSFITFPSNFLLPIFLAMFAFQAIQALRENSWR